MPRETQENLNGTLMEKKSSFKIKHLRWYICALLFFATTINYIDRQVLGILAPDLEVEIGWSELAYGRIVIAFQLAYAVMMLFAGRIIDRIGTKLGFTIAIIWWSIAAMAHALAKSAFGFGVARFFLGIGEAANFPASIKTIAEWFPKSERALATGIFNGGTNIGAIIAPMAVPLIAAHWGWQGAFIVTGALGFLWLFGWWYLYDQPQKHKHLEAKELVYIEDGAEEPLTEKTPWKKLFGYRQLWAVALGKMMTDPIWWFYLFWLPKFLAKNHHIRGVDLIPYLTTVYIISDVGSMLGGGLSSYFIKKGWTVNRHADLRLFGAAGHHRRLDPKRLDRCVVDRSGRRLPSGLVCQHLYPGFGHVSAQSGGLGGRHRRLRRRLGRHGRGRVRRPGAEH